MIADSLKAELNKYRRTTGRATGYRLQEAATAAARSVEQLIGKTGYRAHDKARS
jgi:hypothetical protein